MPDKIDPMVSGILNRLEKLAGGTLHHCCFCRLQFYDRRKMAPRTTLEPIQPVPAPAGAVEPTGPPDTASSDE
jgi:hypothetical protein